MAKKLLLDTDIGSDIDDAVALAYLLSHPNCDLLGITTVTGEPDRRAQMASAICMAAGRADIPIYPGSPAPIITEQRQLAAPQAAALDRWPHQERFPRGEAVDFMRRTIRANPGEVTLLTIGPLTNIGLLFSIDPEIPSLLKELVMMCGLFTNRVVGFGPLEWNADGDPHATAVVYRSAVPVHRSVGLDVTTQVVMPADEVRARFSAPVLRPVLDFAEIWFRQWGGIMFHDPLAAAVVFSPELCQFDRGFVSVEITSPRMAGYTYWEASHTGPHEIAIAVNGAEFFKSLFSVF